MDRPSPFRPLVRELERRGVPAVVAQAPYALLVANLTSGRVGAMQYHSSWPRLRDRYADRFLPGRPVTCVVDPDYPGAPCEDLGRHLRILAIAHPGAVRRVGEVGLFEVWEADVPLLEVLDP